MANAGRKRADGTRASVREGYEITAMNDCWQAIEQLPPESRKRALEWLVAKSFNWPQYRIREPEANDFVSTVARHFEKTFGGPRKDPT